MSNERTSIQYGVYHVSVDGWSNIRLHESIYDAISDYQTCGMNCALVQRVTGGEWGQYEKSN